MNACLLEKYKNVLIRIFTKERLCFTGRIILIDESSLTLQTVKNETLIFDVDDIINFSVRGGRGCL